MRGEEVKYQAPAAASSMQSHAEDRWIGFQSRFGGMVITRQVVANGKFRANVAIPTLAMVNQTYPAKFADLLALGLWEEYAGPAHTKSFERQGR